MNIKFVFFTLMLTVIHSTYAAETTITTSKLVKEVVLANFKACQEENLDDMMLTMHSMSPSRAATKAQCPALFNRFDLTYKLVAFNFVAVSGIYAIARVKQRTSKIKGAPFADNTLESLMVFKQDKGKWKLWTQATLEIKFE